VKAQCRTKVEAEIGRPLQEGEARFIDQAVVRSLRQLSNDNRSAFKAMSPAQRIRQAGARAAEELRGYRYKGDSWSAQDRADLQTRLEREITKAGGKIDVAIENSLPGGNIAEYQDRVIAFALNAIQGKTINGTMKALQATLSHELLHWARSMGFYTPEQWAELVTAAGKRRMTKGDAVRTGKLKAWEELRTELGQAPTYQQYADRVYANKPNWARQEEAVAVGIEIARARYEQENVDANDTMWRKAIGTLIKMGRAVVRAIGHLTANQQSKLAEFYKTKEAELRSGAQARQAPPFAQAGVEPSQRIKVQKIKETVNKTFQTEEINDLIRRIEDPNVSAAEIAAAPIWGSLEDLQEGPLVTGEQIADPAWWGEKQYPHPDGGDELISPKEMVNYVRSVFEGRATKKVRYQKRATIITGAPGAGKSTISKQIARRMGAAIVDTDSIKQYIPENNDGINDADISGEARALAGQAYRELTEEGANFIHERVGDDMESLQKQVARLRELGYTVDVVHVRADFTTRMRRMAARFLGTGRAVGVSDMIRIGNKPSYVHRAAVRMQLADGFYEVENAQGNGYRVLSRSGNPRPGTTKGVHAAAGGGLARVGRLLGGERPTPGLKAKAIEYAELFEDWNKTAGYNLDRMASTGGARSKLADKTALAQAEQMAKDGVDANTIRLKTGWFRPLSGKGKWRFIISDAQIKFKSQFAEDYRAGKTKYNDLNLFQGRKLSDYIDSPIFEHYPWLRNVRVVVDRSYDGAAANPFLNMIVFGNAKGDKTATPQGILAHEIQHLISEHERFERGGNAHRIYDALIKRRGWNVNPPKWAVSLAINGYDYGDVKSNSTMYRAIALYLALTDELQARSAEQEVNMTAEQLRPENYQPPVTMLETLPAFETLNALEHLKAIPLKLLAAIPIGGVGIYGIAKALITYFSMQSFTPKDAYNLPQIVAAANEEEDNSPLVHQEFGLTREQAKSFERMRVYPPVKAAMDRIGLGDKVTKITRQQYVQLKRALDSISDEDFITDGMSASKRIVARRLMQNFFKDEKAFKAFLEHGIIDGGFVGLDRPQNIGPMESRKYTPPGGRFGAASSSTAYPIIGEQPGFTDDVAYVAGQIASVPRKKGIGSTIIQDKRMKRLRPWNVAGGKLDEIDKLAEGSLRAMWRGVFQNIPILQQIASKSSRYFQFGGIPDQAALEVLRTMFQGRVGKAEELATEIARDVSKGLNISYGDAWKAMRGDFSGLAKMKQSVREDAKDKLAKLKAAMTEADPAKQAAMLAALPAELQAAGKRAMQAIQEVGDALVEHRIISKRQRDKFSGHYLFRAYMEHFDTYKPTMGTRASGAPYRAWRNAIPKDKRLTKGEIESLPFLLYMSIERPLHDIAAYSYLNSLMHHSMNSPSNPRWFLPDSLVMFGGKWRSLFYVAKQMKQSETSLNAKKAELSDLGGVSANSDLARNLRQEIRLLERVIQDMQLVINANPTYASILAEGQLPDGYRQLPDDSGKYGDAAGGIVLEQIYNDITGGLTGFADENTIAGKAMDAYSAFNRNIKFMLTVANPPTHLRNIYSNILMLARSGTNPMRVVQAITEMARYNGGKGKASPAVEAAIKFGAMKQTFTDAELRVMDQFARGIENEIKKANFRKGVEKVFGQNTVVDKALSSMDVASAIMGAIKNAYGDGASWLYQNEDVIFKVAKIADELDRGTPPAMAALEARKYFFDYSAVTPLVRWLSNTAIAPFIRYTYFAVPNFLEQVATSPWRLAYTGYGQYIALMALASLLWGFAPDDAKDTLNEYLAERPMLVPVPWRDEHDRLQWIDLGYMMPEGALLGLAMAGKDADPQAALRALGATGGPLTTMYIGWTTGIDPFRGQPIYEETDDQQTQAAKMSWFALRSMMPSFFSYYTPPLPGETKGGPGFEALWGTGLDSRGEPTQTNGQLAARALGLNVYPNDVVYGQQKRLRQWGYQMRQLDQELDRTYRARDLTPEARDRRIQQLRRNYDRILAERNEYIRSTAEAVEAEGRRQTE